MAALVLWSIYAVKCIQPDAAVFHGTPVTKETFTAWKERFDAEMAGSSSRDNKEVKLTGIYNIIIHMQHIFIIL